MNINYQSILRISWHCLFLLLLSCGSTVAGSEGTENIPTPPQPTVRQKIMLALLLDTSNSMDGLIEQAKSQLWTIVNELAAAKCSDGERPEIRIALFEYGNDGLPMTEGYMRMVTDLTSDLDVISKRLFELTTNGGEEYCGYAIDKSLRKLNWSDSQADLKMIFIAGNEPFSQGSVNYQIACKLAKEKDIVVNTIFCGDFQEGINTSWKHGADLTGGSYMSIQQNRQTVYVETPYDKEIDRLNDAINKTYIYYGKSGAERKEMQMAQDDNAAAYSQANKVQRTISKSSHVYKNSSWDLVDAAEENEKVIEEADEEYLPEEMKDMSVEERKVYVTEQATKRDSLKKKVQELAVKRKQYIADHQPVEAGSDEMLDKAMINSIKEVAATKNLSFQ